MKMFTGEHPDIYEASPIGKVLPIAPKRDYARAARQAGPAKAPPSGAA